MTAQRRKGELFLLRGKKVLSYRETANKPKVSPSSSASSDYQKYVETGANSDHKRVFLDLLYVNKTEEATVS